ncbi:PREDICTED: ras GTPase-activating protein-binding protein 2 [Tarenaya hassleriana]|uniref:ras GTPase-activating protein-binding protein 2 n=1 Tax=Tarenaya hassleriana TaxID=28532 RepID=UPI00053C68EB|nr:PREDICTED: ras GTPase-activating protein-binding protein 2 [Tarenaya hassleriana]
MAAEPNAPSVDPHIVGNAFVQKYYNHLYESPAEVHRFYLEDSVLGRPGPDGEMVSVKSLKAINEQLMSFDYQNSKIQILTADSQESYKDGVVTLVTGLITGKDGEGMRFSQSFFLVPQKGSYFVLNDVFRYVSDELSESEANNEVKESPQVIQSTATVSEEPANEGVEMVKEAAEQVNVLTQPVVKLITETSVKNPENIRENGEAKVSEKKVVNENGHYHKASEDKPQQSASKKSFAVIVQTLAQNVAPFHVKASPAKPSPVEKSSFVPEPKSPVPVPEDAPAKTSEQPSEGGSIFVANLPMDATPEQLHETFKHFGAIKQDGIQVRSYKQKGNCFGFVAYESAEAVRRVLQAHHESPIRIGHRRVSIEEKRGASNENGRPSARNGGYRNENGYRNDGYRPRGNANGGRGGYGRNGYERRGEMRNGDAPNAKAYQNGGSARTRD